MRLKRILIRSLAVALLAAHASTSTFAQEAAPAQKEGVAASAPQACADLLEAYAIATHAKARDEAFAKKAAEEGFSKVASVFKALAASDGVLQKRIARAIEKAGAQAKADTAAMEVKSTRENVQVAIACASENVLAFSMILKKLGGGSKSGAMAIQWASLAEVEHARYLKEVGDKPGDWKGGSQEYLVCPECGRVTADLATAKCPICAEPRKTMISVK